MSHMQICRFNAGADAYLACCIENHLYFSMQCVQLASCTNGKVYSHGYVQKKVE